MVFVSEPIKTRDVPKITYNHDRGALIWIDTVQLTFPVLTNQRMNG